MKKVDIIEIDNDGEQSILFTVGLIAGQPVVVSGNKKAAQVYGVPANPVQGLGGKWVGPDNGLGYLRTLRFQFTGSRLRATDVYED